VDKKLRPRKSDPYLAERGHFVSCIVEDKERLTTADQMIGLQKALDAIVESAETGEWVTTG
jgi:predicted dehydrogenase